jgi:beta-glucosidase
VRRHVFGAAILSFSSALGAQVAPPSVDQRVDALVARMTLDEKAAQLQDSAPAIPRLGIPAYAYWNEALHGVARSGEATVFPQAIGMAATWDKALIHAEGDVISTEARAKYNRAQKDGNSGKYFGLDFWSPNINIFRDPRWGRGQETYGEDPYLTGTLATEFIRGIQGSDPDFYRAIATSKHFAVHSGPEPLRHQFDVDPSAQDLAETYLAAFRRTVVEGKVASLMCAYNSVEGKPACASGMLLDQTLRRDWGFKGYVVSDCGAIDDVSSGHHFTPTNVEAVAAAMKAGTDLACVFKNEYLDIPKAVQRGLLPEADVNRALHRVLAARMRLGILGASSPKRFDNIPYSENHSQAHRELALRAAREAIVLLKNDGVLPLRHSARIAVVGPGATSLISLEGNYNGTPTDPVLPLDGIRAAFASSSIVYAQGSAFADGAGVAVPRTAFPGGISATFFNGTGFNGPAIATRHYVQLDHNWNWVAPAPGVDARNLSVRWSATLKVPAPGDYRFELQRRRCDAVSEIDRYTIAIEGAEPLHIDAPCSARDAGDSPALTIHFADARPRKLVVEYAHKSASFAPAITLVWRAPAEALRDEAMAAARKSDVVLAFVGLNAWLEGEEMPVQIPGFDGGDRTDIRLPAPQRVLLDALEATGKPVIIVLQSGSAVPLGGEGAKARAIIQAWYGGEQGGRAITDVLAGGYNPAGRLPITVYRGNEQLAAFTDYSMKGRTYRYFGGQPEYPFGYGLSYTHFAYSDLKLGSASLAAGDTQRVSVRVRNDGPVAGDEVVQLYVSTPDRPDAPLRSLKGFARVRLGPRETRAVDFKLDPRDLAFADKDGVMRITPGNYSIWVGGGQPGTGAAGQAATFRTRGELALQP